MVYYTGGRFGEIDNNREGLHHEKENHAQAGIAELFRDHRSHSR